MKVKAVFFDRDGVLDVDVGYLSDPAEFEWIEGAPEALAFMHSLGYKLFVVTNQSGIARGYYTVEDMEKVHVYMQQELEKCGGCIDRFYYCPHYREGEAKEYVCECDCRKPKPGMILQAMKEYDIDKDASFLIGDRDKDLEAAANAGIRGYKFTGGNLLDFVKNILKG
ncbi:MAG: HAD family hydrolase [Phascolarctobacterium sp.]|nr:HAD family hydrolase [Phascolarctobacterium sp.]MCD8174657.1 HAD family hydrolase [Phascolarctobacterium sp.]